jgi:hypothetical protein
MKIYVILFLVVLTTIPTLLHGQTFEMKKSRIFYGEKLVKPKQVLELMKEDPEAYKEFKQAKSNYDAGQVIGFAGGFLIGWPLGTALGGGDPQWGLMGGGAALVLLSIPLQVGYKKHARKAIDIYNGKTVSHVKPSFGFRFSGTQASVCMRF